MAKILLVDDCLERMRFIKVAIEEGGHWISATYNLKIAWERILNVRFRPDLMIVVVENKRHADILKVVHKAVSRMPVIILFREPSQLSGISICDFWKTKRIPFNPIDLAKEVELILMEEALQ